MGNNYILIGMPGSGKTTAGKILAKRLDYKYIDMDSLIEEFEGISVRDIFTLKGEEYFRSLETRVINTFSEVENKVIATGGGTFENEENRAMLKTLGKVIYLYTEPDILYGRRKDDTYRPLLQVDNPHEEIKKLLDKRESNYRLADCIIDTSNLDTYNVVDEIIRIVNGENTGN